MDKGTQALDYNEHVLSFFLDFAKQIDTVDHDFLTLKLIHTGICGDVLIWFKNYMHEQKVF